MGIEALAAVALLSTAATTIKSVHSSTLRSKGPEVPDPAAAADAARKQSAAAAASRRGRASTLATAGGGLSESPTLGRPSLLGAA